MGGDQQTLAGGAGVAHQVDDQPRVQRIEPRKRLVEHDQRRIADEGGRELNFLLLPLRELFQAARPQRLQIDPCEPLCDLALGFRPGEAFESSEVGQDRVDAGVLVEPPFFGQVPDRDAAGCAWHAQRDATLVRARQPHDDSHERRLAGAVRAEEADDGARADIERHVIEYAIATERPAHGRDGHEGFLHGDLPFRLKPEATDNRSFRLQAAETPGAYGSGEVAERGYGI